jgi:hypothetical protein
MSQNDSPVNLQEAINGYDGVPPLTLDYKDSKLTTEMNASSITSYFWGLNAQNMSDSAQNGEWYLANIIPNLPAVTSIGDAYMQTITLTTDVAYYIPSTNELVSMDGAQLVNHSPDSTITSESYNHGFSWNLGGTGSLGGTISANPGATVGGSLSSGVTFSNNHIVNIPGVTIKDLTSQTIKGALVRQGAVFEQTKSQAKGSTFHDAGEMTVLYLIPPGTRSKNEANLSSKNLQFEGPYLIYQAKFTLFPLGEGFQFKPFMKALPSWT